MIEDLVLGSCGLACMLCSAKLNNECKGCNDSKRDKCKIKKCCMEKGIEGCYECNDYPCDHDMFQYVRVKAFIECSKEMGMEALGKALIKNHENGIYYHPADGTKGAYDQLDNIKSIKALVKEGK